MKQLRNFKKQNSIPKGLSDNPQMQDALNKYGNLDEDALINQLVMQVRESRENGTYDENQMRGYIEMLSPHISQSQKEKLTNIISIISSEDV